MKKYALLCLISTFCILNLNAQNTIQGKLMITGGVTDYFLPSDFESYCPKSTLQKIGSEIIRDVIKSTIENISKEPLNNIELIENDSSFNFMPRPFKDIELYTPGMASFGGPPTEFYIFGNSGQMMNDFNKYLYPKDPKFVKNQVPDLKLLASECDYTLIIWPIWWYHVRTETASVNENYTYCMIAYGLYSTKSNEILLSDSYWSKDKGKVVEYDKLIAKLGEKVANDVIKSFSKK
jgi:hypothetical protein